MCVCEVATEVLVITRSSGVINIELCLGGLEVCVVETVVCVLSECGGVSSLRSTVPQSGFFVVVS